MAQLFQFPYRTVAEISLRALVKNLVTIRAVSKREVIPVVKADAYGHGMVPVARALYTRGSVEMFAVATLEEGIELRKKMPHAVQILVLSGFLPHQWDAYVKYGLVPVIHSLNHLKSLLGRSRLPEFHLKVDTGMNRLGLSVDEVGEAVKIFGKLGAKLSGLMTHFADSEVTTSTFIDEQMARFEEVHRTFISERILNTDARIHVANSGAIFRGKLGFSNAVRPGLSLYGLSPNPRWDATTSELTPVLQWKARVLAVKGLKRGDTVGYGRTYKARRKEKIAILPIGYADGLPRSLGNVGSVLVQGKRVQIRGRVSMDLTAIDCASLSHLREGTLVTLIGADGKDRISAWELASWAETIPYEIFCGISARVPRVYLD